MAKRLEREISGEELPARFTVSYVALDKSEWWDEFEILPERLKDVPVGSVRAWRMVRAHRRMFSARDFYLRTLTVKPRGVGDITWCIAHGISYVHRFNDPKGKSIGF